MCDPRQEWSRKENELWNSDRSEDKDHSGTRENLYLLLFVWLMVGGAVVCSLLLSSGRVKGADKPPQAPPVKVAISGCPCGIHCICQPHISGESWPGPTNCEMYTCPANGGIPRSLESTPTSQALAKPSPAPPVRDFPSPAYSSPGRPALAPLVREFTPPPFPQRVVIPGVITHRPFYPGVTTGGTPVLTVGAPPERNEISWGTSQMGIMSTGVAIPAALTKRESIQYGITANCSPFG
jgi:hypothetical protein